MILLKLFLSFSKIGLFAIGGAYSFLPLIEKEVVDKYQWLSKEEFLELVGMVKVFPGAISIKFATYTGYKVAGFPGAFIANIGNALAAVIFIIFLAEAYNKYKDLERVKGAFSMVQLGVFSMLIAVAFQLINPNHLVQVRSLIVIISCFTLFIYTKVHPAFVIMGCALLGALIRS